MWVIPELTPAFVKQMSSVLRLLGRPYNKSEPVIVLDEKPVFLRGDKRVPRRSSKGILKRDYEYIRLGKANIFGIAEPKTGRNLTQVTPDRSKKAFAKQLIRIAKSYPKAKRIHLLVDNLNTHRPTALEAILDKKDAQRIIRRFKFHYTPKHASWLNPAEIVLSLLSREALGRQRFPSIQRLRAYVNAWTRRTDRARRKINWRFTVRKAKKKFRL